MPELLNPSLNARLVAARAFLCATAQPDTPEAWLHAAAARADVELVEHLLEQGVRPTHAWQEAGRWTTTVERVADWAARERMQGRAAVFQRIAWRYQQALTQAR